MSATIERSRAFDHCWSLQEQVTQVTLLENKRLDVGTVCQVQRLWRELHPSSMDPDFQDEYEAMRKRLAPLRAQVVFSVIQQALPKTGIERLIQWGFQPMDQVLICLQKPATLATAQFVRSCHAWVPDEKTKTEMCTAVAKSGWLPRYKQYLPLSALGNGQ